MSEAFKYGLRGGCKGIWMEEGVAYKHLGMGPSILIHTHWDEDETGDGDAIDR